jgi:hypothetical protein
MHQKIESSVPLLVSETCLFPTGSDYHACCDRLIILDNSEEVIIFPILLFIPGNVLSPSLFNNHFLSYSHT